jgi:hypothetical protein
MCSRLRSFIAIACSHSSGPRTVLRQVKHRSAKVRAPRSGGPKKCHGILPMQGRRIQASCRQSECDHSLALSFSRRTVNNELSSALRLASEPVPKSQQRAGQAGFVQGGACITPIMRWMCATSRIPTSLCHRSTDSSWQIAKRRTRTSASGPHFRRKRLSHRHE